VNLVIGYMALDLFASSAKDVWEGMMHEAYGGEIPAGGWDFPTGCILSKAHIQRSDLHVESIVPVPLYDEPDYAPLSYDYDIAPLTYAREQGPGHTRTPFKFPPGFETPFGYLGKAYRPFSEICCILLAYNQDILGLENWFKDEWGIPDHVDLRLGFPSLSSLGDAAWAGISRSLRPFCSMLKSAHPGLKITQHGTHRTKFGQHKLVDWERVREISKCVALQLIGDDYRAAKQHLRLDFAIVGSELPDAPQPKDLAWDFVYFRKNTEEGALWRTLQDAFDRTSKFEGVREERYSKGKLEFVIEETLHPHEVMQVINTYRTAKQIDVNWENMVSEDVFPTDADHRRILDRPKLQKGTMQDLLALLIGSRIKTHNHLFPRPAHMRIIIGNMDIEDKRKEALKEGYNLLVAVCGPNFLGLIRKLGDIIEAGRGLKYLSELAHLLGAFPGDFQIHVPSKLWDLLAHRDTAIKYMCGLFIKMVVLFERAMENPSLYDLFDECVLSGNIGVVMSSFIHRHRINWANRFSREARGRRAEDKSDPFIVREQIKSRVLRNARFKISDKSKIEVDVGSVADCLKEMGESFLRKRKKFGQEDPKLPSYFGQDFPEYVESLDALVATGSKFPPKVPFSPMLTPLWEMFTEFGNDVSKLFSQVVQEVANQRQAGLFLQGESPESEDVLDPLSCGEESRPATPGYDKRWGYESSEAGVDDEDADTWLRKLVQEAPDDEEEGFLDFEDEPLPQTNRAGLLDLNEELSEDYPNLTALDRIELMDRYGEFVTVQDYESISNEQREKNRKKLADGILGKVAPDDEGPDLL